MDRGLRDTLSYQNLRFSRVPIILYLGSYSEPADKQVMV